MTTPTRRRTDTRHAVYEILLDGIRFRDIGPHLGISNSAVAKHIKNLRVDGLVVEPPQLPAPGLRKIPPVVRTTDQPSAHPVRVEFWQQPIRGWVTAVPIPKVTNPKEHGPHGLTDWLLMVVGADPDTVCTWVHMRGQRISERQVAERLVAIRFATAARLITMGLGYATGLELILEEETPRAER